MNRIYSRIALACFGLSLFLFMCIPVAYCDFESEVKDFLRTLLYTREEVDQWFADEAFPFCKYDSMMGYLHKYRLSPEEGLDDSAAVYTYNENDARSLFMYRNEPCRINTYGNSFTSCEQVNDGETWQEVLAAHLCEPVRNYGIGGYSVYQSYLRMIKEEKNTPSEYIIFNIFEDDHYRNLISWQRIRFGTHPKSFHPTLPYLKVDLENEEIIECENPCPTYSSVYNLTDLDWAYETFKDDFLLKIVMAQRLASEIEQGPELKDRHLAPALADKEESAASIDEGKREIYDVIEDLAAEHGMKVTIEDPGTLLEVANDLYFKAAMLASRKVVEKVEDYARDNGKKVLFVLSYGSGSSGIGGGGMAGYLSRGYRFDEEFVEWLKDRNAPVVDLMEAHRADYANYKTGVDDYLKRFYVGHYGPLGNFFCTFAIKDELVNLLEPKPLPYKEF